MKKPKSPKKKRPIWPKYKPFRVCHLPLHKWEASTNKRGNLERLKSLNLYLTLILTHSCAAECPRSLWLLGPSNVGYGCLQIWNGSAEEQEVDVLSKEIVRTCTRRPDIQSVFLHSIFYGLADPREKLFLLVRFIFPSTTFSRKHNMKFSWDVFFFQPRNELASTT